MAKTSSSNSKASRDAAKYNLRTKSIQNRIEVERRKNEPRHPKPKQRPAPLSKYRRRTANFRERCRMQEMNDAFKRLQSVVPGDEASERLSKEHHLKVSSMSAAAASKATKIHTLKLAVNYISALTAMLNQSEHQQQERPQLQSNSQSRTAMQTHNFNSLSNHGNNSTNVHCNTLNHHMNSSAQFMGKSKACQTVTMGGGRERTAIGVNSNSIISSTCVASQTDLGISGISTNHNTSDLNVALNQHLHQHHQHHCHQLAQQQPLQSYYDEGLTSSYSSSMEEGNCFSSKVSLLPSLPACSKERLLNCEISHPFYGYSHSHQEMSHQPTSGLHCLVTDTSATSLPPDSLFLSHSHSGQPSLHNSNSSNSLIISASPFDMGSNTHHFNSLVSSVDSSSSGQATLLDDDFSAIIEDLQVEDGHFALVDGLID